MPSTTRCVIAISSSAGLAAGFDFVSAYAASKFDLEGWVESLQAEVAPFGIHTTIVNPGFFRTELLTEQSTDYAAPSIEDYAERRAAQLDFWKAQNGKQSGDPVKLAQALLAGQEPPPRRFIAGADAIATAEQRSRRTGTCRRRSHSIKTPPRRVRRTSIRIVRSAFEFCVRTGSDAPRNPGRTGSLTTTLRCTSLLREVGDGECVGACRCALLSATGINFQACLIDRSSISPL
jgi:short chain dehydrogenase